MNFAEGTVDEQGKQPYKYNGKELDTQHALNLYDYSARHYDGQIGRLTTIDPHSENYYAWSPYAYVMNNPLKYIDPTGMDTVFITPSFVEVARIPADGADIIVDAAEEVIVTPEKPGKEKVVVGNDALFRLERPLSVQKFGGALEPLGARDPFFVILTLGRSLALASTSSSAAASASSGALSTTNQISNHALQRMMERGISKKMVETAIKKGVKVYDPKNGTINYILKGGFGSGKDLLVGTNPVSGLVTTVIRGKNLTSTRFIPL